MVGYAEDTWPQLLRDFAAASCEPRYEQAPDLDLADRPFPRRDLLPERRYLTNNVFEATRGCVHNCDFCVVPTAWGRKPYQKPVERSRRGHPPARRAQADLRRSESDRRSRLRAAAVRGLIPLRVQWYGWRPCCWRDDLELLELAARSGCKGLLMGLESISPAEPPAEPQGLQFARQIRARGRAAARPRHRAAGLFRLRPRPRRAGCLPEDRRVRGAKPASICRASPSSRRSRTPRCTSASRPKAASSRGTGSCTTASTWSFSPRSMSVRRTAARAPKRPGSMPTAFARSRGGIAHSPAPVAGAARHQPRLSLLRPQPEPLLQLRLDHRPRDRGDARAKPAATEVDAAARMRLTIVHPCIGREPGHELHPHLADGAAARRDPRRPHTDGRRGALLRRSDGSDPFRRADGSRRHQRRNLHRQARLPDRHANTAGAACRS